MVALEIALLFWLATHLLWLHHHVQTVAGNHPGHLGPLGRWDQSMGHTGPWLLGGSPLGIKLDRIDGGSICVYIYIYMCVCAYVVVMMCGALSLCICCMFDCIMYAQIELYI